jgi:hypothetical protein
MDDQILVLSQLSQVASALLAGLFGGLTFELYQKICYGSSKRRLRPTAYLKGDALFALCLIGAWLIFWFSCTDGSLRFSVFIWLALGFGLYFLTMRKSVHRLLHQIKRLLRLLRAILLPAPRAPHKEPGKARVSFSSGKLMDDSAALLVKLDHQAINASRLASATLKTAAQTAQSKSREQAARLVHKGREQAVLVAKKSYGQVKILAKKIGTQTGALGEKIIAPPRRLLSRRPTKDEEKKL